jgi:hypothetical protein
MTSSRSRGAARPILTAVVAVLLGLAGFLGWGYWYYLKRDVPVRYSDPLERYKYQSIGSEPTALPYYIWQILPEVCSADLPEGGYAGFGFIYEQGHDRPIGVTLRTMGVPRAGINCATCHTGVVRTSPTAPPQVIVGMPSQQLDLQSYARFLLKCITGPQFTTDHVMAAIERKQHLGPLDRLVYQYLIVPGTKREVNALKHRLDWMDARPPFGPGRFDAFNPVKADFGVDMAKDHSIATADFPSIWNQQVRKHMALHWDGSNSSAAERNVAASIGAGATPDTVDFEELNWTAAFLDALPPPKYPFPIDQGLAQEGSLVFEAYCSRCHGPTGSQTGKTTPIDDVGTDRARYFAFDQAFADQFNQIGKGYTWKVKGYRRASGYLNVLLDGVWARAPYLHNGSVPNLKELLDAPDHRDSVFYRGYDVYDPAVVGFVTSGPEAERAGFRYDTTLRGNGNGGHLYGVDLSPENKRALLEYLKTL